jgi:hypothetical protein
MLHQVIHLSRYPVHFTAHCEDAMFAFGGNLFAWWKDAVALHYYITRIKKLVCLIGFKYQYELDLPRK